MDKLVAPLKPFAILSVLFIGLLMSFYPPVADAHFQLYMPEYATTENGLGAITGKIMGGLKPVGKVKLALIHKGKILDYTETDDDGYFDFHYIVEGYYEVKAVKDGFVTNTVSHIPVVPDHITKVNFYMPEINNSHLPDDPMEQTYDEVRRHMDHPDVPYPRRVRY